VSVFVVNSFYHWIVTMDIFFSLLQVHFTMCQNLKMGK